METQKRRRGDRRDGRLLRELDSLHFITGIIYPNRCDNEAYISVKVDLTAMNAYLAKKNEAETDFPYTMFHLVVAALLKTITLRPKLNRFIVNSNFYQRNEVSAAFVVKKQFSDKGAEALAFLHGKDEFLVQGGGKREHPRLLRCGAWENDAHERNHGYAHAGTAIRGTCPGRGRPESERYLRVRHAGGAWHRDVRIVRNGIPVARGLVHGAAPQSRSAAV